MSRDLWKTRLAYGGDYNPEQWPRSTWLEDIVLMRQAKVNLVTVGVFAWSRLEPRPGEYDFAWLDDVLDLLHDGGVRVNLATPTAAPPPWFAGAHPETRPITADGTTLAHGSRDTYCAASPAYREAAKREVAGFGQGGRRYVVVEVDGGEAEQCGHPRLGQPVLGGELGGVPVQRAPGRRIGPHVATGPNDVGVDERPHVVGAVRDGRGQPPRLGHVARAERGVGRDHQRSRLLRPAGPFPVPRGVGPPSRRHGRLGQIQAGRGVRVPVEPPEQDAAGMTEAPKGWPAPGPRPGSCRCLDRASRVDGQPGLRSHRGRGAEQAGLADAGLAADDEHAAGAGCRRGNEAADGRQLGVSTDKRQRHKFPRLSGDPMPDVSWASATRIDTSSARKARSDG